MEQCKFDIDDDLAVHVELLEEYFVVKDIKDDTKKRSYLLTSLTTRVYKLLRNLTNPEAPKDVAYADLLKLMKKQFVSNINVYKERRKFYEAIQEAGEDVLMFFNKIKSLSVNCDFGNVLDNILIDRFICGLKRGQVFDRLCEESNYESIEICLELARSKEDIIENVLCSKISKNKNHVSSRSQFRKKKNDPLFPSTTANKCNACGRGEHDFKKCKYRNYRCRKCKSKGHLEIVCRKNNAQQNLFNKNNYVAQHSDNEELSLFKMIADCNCHDIGDGVFSCNMMQVDGMYERDLHLEVNQGVVVGVECEQVSDDVEVKFPNAVSSEEVMPVAVIADLDAEINQSLSGKVFSFEFVENDTNFCNSFSDLSAFVVALQVHGHSIQFEIDTGSAVSIIPERIYNERFMKCKTERFTSTLRAYNGAVIQVIGMVQTEVRLGNITKSAKLVVVKSNGQPLLGRDLLRTFGFKYSFELVLNSIKNDNRLENLLEEYKHLFDGNLGRYKYEKIILETENVSPIFINPRKVAFAYKESLEQELDRLESIGIIKQTQTVSWGTPLVTVLKNDKSLRVCADYSVTINKHLKDKNYPLPRIEDIFHSLQGGKKFSKLDLFQAYNQLEVDEETSKLLAWSTHKGVYTVHRLPFGCKPNSSIFQSIMDKTLLGCKMTVAFLDDVVVSGRDDQEHYENLQNVLDKLSNAGFKVNKNKCEFFKSRICYLGYVIDAEGLHKDPRKVEAITSMPNPKNHTQVKSFCGLVNYYAKFVPNLSSILKPLYELTTKEKFEWNNYCDEAIEKVKKLITSDIVLIHYDQSKPLVLQTDASEYGIGACLSHQIGKCERPIVFYSRTLSCHERNYSMVDKEALAIYFGVKKCEQYLMGREFLIKTDHKPLIGIFGSKKGIPIMAANRLQRWSIYLSNFNFKILHIKGTENKCADALSRLTSIKECGENDEDITYLKFVEEHFSKPINAKDIECQTDREEILRLVKGFILSGWPEMKKSVGEMRSFYDKRLELTVENNIIMWGHRVVIPKLFRTQLLREIHSAHSGIVKSKEIVRSFFWWPNVDRDIEGFIKQCAICNKCSSNPPKLASKRWPEATKPMERVHVDYCGPLDKYNFLIIKDAFSKWIEVFKMKEITSQVTIEKLTSVFASLGIPNLLVSDNGPSLVSDMVEKFCLKNGIKHITSPPYHPESNGTVENAVRVFKEKYNKICLDPNNAKLSIDEKVAKMLYYYRISIHSLTRKSPYELMYGRLPSLRWEKLKSKPKVEARNLDEVVLVPQSRRFEIDEQVCFRNFGRGQKWIEGRIVEINGDRVYKIITKENKMFKRHVDHIISNKCKINLDDTKRSGKSSKESVSFESSVYGKSKMMNINDQCSQSGTGEVGGEGGTAKNCTNEIVNDQNSAGSSQDTSAAMNVRRKSMRNVKFPDRLNL